MEEEEEVVMFWLGCWGGVRIIFWVRWVELGWMGCCFICSSSGMVEYGGSNIEEEWYGFY